MAQSATPPFVSPATSRAPENRHGSSEQESRDRDVFGRPWSGVRRTQSQSRIPRTPRVRSPDARSRERERRDWRDFNDDNDQQRSPSQPPPSGFGSRLLVIEKQLREHQQELATVKVLLNEASTNFEGLRVWRTEHENRLDKTFADWGARLAESDKIGTNSLEASQANMLILAGRVSAIEAKLNELNGPRPNVGPTSGPQDPNWSPLSGQNRASQNANGLGTAAPTASSNSGFGAPPQPSTPPGFGAQSGFGQGATPSAPAPPNSWNPPPSSGPAPAPASPPASSWAAPGAGTNMMAWNDKFWTVDPKPPKELRAFDGDIRHYDKWRLRVRYHFSSTNMFYKDIFAVIEQSKTICSFKVLAATHVPHLPNVNWAWVSHHIWDFWVRCLIIICSVAWTYSPRAKSLMASSYGVGFSWSSWVGPSR